MYFLVNQMISKKNKKASNMGLMISFAIFVTFVLFVIIILQPTFGTNEDKQALSSGIKDRFAEKATEEITTVTIKLSSSVSSNCVSFGSFLSDFNVSRGIIIKDEFGDVVSGSISSTDSDMLQINRNLSEDFFKIYSAESFDDLNSESLTCSSVTEGSDYEVGVTKKEKYISEERIYSVINSYSDYSYMIEELLVPSGTDIEISFEFENGTRISTGEENPDTNIFVTESAVEYINDDGKILPGKIITKIW